MSERATTISREILHREGFFPEESSGLFIGISNFEDDRFAPVPFAVDDAVDLAWVFSLELGLIDPSRCVLALSGEPQKEVSRLRLGALRAAGAKRDRSGLAKVYQLATELSQAGGSRGLFVLTVSTHGVSEQGSDYLIAADSRREFLLKTGIEVKDLFELAAKATQLRRLVMLDACREQLNRGLKSLADAAMAKSFAGAISKASGLTVLSGSTAGGYSYDDMATQNGVFSGALVDGLLGAAAPDHRGFITVATLAEFAQERVLAWVRKHRRDHLFLSRGIEKRFDEDAEHLPLAINPQRSRAIEEYQRRRILALVLLRENIGDVLDGRSFEDIKAFLPETDLPAPPVEELLVEIEALDGTKRAQRSLMHFLSQLRRLQARTAESSFFNWKRNLLVEISAGLALAVTLGIWSWHKAPLDGTVASVPPPMVVDRNQNNQPEPGAAALDGFGILYRWIPGGTYPIGSPEEDKERETDETLRSVSIQGFWLAETEITQKFWMQHVPKNPSRFGNCAQCPIEQVSWFEAMEFANLLSQKAGLDSCYVLTCGGILGDQSFTCRSSLRMLNCTGYWLPTEAEWEVAARAQVAGSLYRARHGSLEEIAWYAGNSSGTTHPVGQIGPNAWGLRDMLGNVWEWTSDPHDGEPLRISIRGGSWDGYAKNVRAARRNWSEPAGRDDSVGFRLALGRMDSREGSSAR